MSLHDALKSLEKALPDAFESQDRATGFSTGSLAVDYVTGIGGFPEGCLTEVMGWEASGKTTLCLQSFASAQRRGLTPVYLDPERGVDMAYAELVGCDFHDRRKGLYATPSTFEDTLTILDALMGEVPIIFVDSVSALVTKALLEGKLDETEAIGTRARVFSRMLPVLTKRMRESGTAVVLINQLREKIETGFAARFGPKHTSTGGRAIPYYAWMRLNMAQVKKGDVKRKRMSLLSGKEEDVPVASEHAVDLIKSKVGVAYQKAPFYIRYDEESNIFGMDNVQTLLHMGVGSGVIQKKGSFFNLKLEGASGLAHSVQGEEAMHKFLISNPDVTMALAKSLGVNWELYA